MREDSLFFKMIKVSLKIKSVSIKTDCNPVELPGVEIILISIGLSKFNIFQGETILLVPKN